MLSIYNMLIIVRIIMQWINPMRHHADAGGLGDILAKVVDPYLNLFKPLGFLRRGVLDFTPLAALMVVNVIQRIFQSFAYSGRMSVGYVLATIVQSLWWSIGSLFLGLLAVLIGIRLYVSYKRTPNAIQYISMLDSWLRTPLDMLHKSLFRGREVSDRVLLWTALGTTVALYIMCSIVVNLLVGFLAGLPF
jgi:YggT family protein